MRVECMGKSTKNTDKLTPDLAYGKKLGTDHVLLMAEQTLTDFGGLPWNHSAAQCLGDFVLKTVITQNKVSLCRLPYLCDGL